MSLSSKVSKEFEPAVRTRGHGYSVAGRVRVRQGSDRSVLATVRGSQNYTTTLQFDDGVLEVSCTCPYYESYGPCKHIWATILTVEKTSYLRAASNGGPVRLALQDEDGVWNDDTDLEEDADLDEDTDFAAVRKSPATLPAPRKEAAPGAKPKRAPKPGWKKILARGRPTAETEPSLDRDAWTSKRQIIYLIDVQATMNGNLGLMLEVAYRELRKDGTWGKLKSRRIPVSQIPQLPEAEDRRLLALLVGAKEDYDWSSRAYYYYNYGYQDTAPLRYRIPEPMLDTLLPMLCRTGRCRLRRSPEDEELPVLQWEEQAPWEFWLEVRRAASGKNYTVQGSLRRTDERMELSEPVLLVPGGVLFTPEKAARFHDTGVISLIHELRRHGPITVPVRQADELLKTLWLLPHMPHLDLPEELRYTETVGAPRPRLKIKAPPKHPWGYERLRGEPSFDYDGSIIAKNDAVRGVLKADERLVVVRDRAAERAALEKLLELGFREPTSTYNNPQRDLELVPKRLPGVVRTLVSSGWHVEAEGKLYRRPGQFNLEVKSGIDWFELHATVDFEGTVAHLPELLAALRRGENVVRLGDGTFGLLPEEWLKKYGALAGLGTATEDHLRFRRSQVGLLDALLAQQPEATCDATFRRVRAELQRFAGVHPSDPPSGFVGTLREYQREGLGWLYFLQAFGFGGCLADDMGLGKTVMALALLESRRERRAQGSADHSGAGPVTTAKKDGKKAGPAHNGEAAQRPGPSLLVAPKSLVFNWKQEAARFTPQLRVLDHTGAARVKAGEHFDDYDVVLTTYGTLRRDVVHLKDIEFDYVILDEGQAIKNARSESAKAVRLLRGRNRLVLSGTPVENHLGELWSLFEFLNPGMLGAASVFQLAGAGLRNPDAETRALLAQALRPFILRRTKEQVAKELPPKLEQTLYCELEPAERKRYNELREHYRSSLLQRIEREGLGRAKIQILEALLRLRQAACHPGLLDKKKTSESSAKLDLLLPQVAEVIDEGHKVLVFSQFTSLLAIVRHRLEREGVRYEYLDGRTRDRAARVERFQNDPDCKLFLISLKAGGLGLNLTAAEYVFLLDPWWNPAVEAQAIDRAHRIGQTQRVFAYRLIARDTVEEKVLRLQETKRELADAVINADNSLIRNLGREDLELLLS